jgi:hypothetical protein
MLRGAILAVFAGLMLLGEGDPSPAGAPKQPFPNVRVDVAARTVEFDGTVPIRLDDPRAPRVYLELLACTPDTKEHESLVVTKAKPSHIHAALLMIGLTPGKPATWTWEGAKATKHPPEGDKVTVEFLWKDAAGNPHTANPSKWIKNATTGAAWPAGPFVFAGSVMKQRAGGETYEADGSGTLIGLASFGTEVVAWTGVISPDSQVDEPEWIAAAGDEGVPPMNTAVTVRLTPAK